MKKSCPAALIEVMRAFLPNLHFKTFDTKCKKRGLLKLVSFPNPLHHLPLATLLVDSSLDTSRLYSQPEVSQLDTRVEQLNLNAYTEYWPIRPADEIYNAKPSYRHLVTSRSISAGPSEWWRLSGTCSGIQRLQSANQRSLESAAPCER